jgi:hypothetical protein
MGRKGRKAERRLRKEWKGKERKEAPEKMMERVHK